MLQVIKVDQNTYLEESKAEDSKKVNLDAVRDSIENCSTVIEEDKKSALKLINCLRFINANEAFIRYAFNETPIKENESEKERIYRLCHSDKSIYKYERDLKHGVLRDSNDTSFHINIEYYANADACIAALKRNIEQFEYAYSLVQKNIAEGKITLKNFITNMRYDEEVGCVAARLAIVMRYAEKLMDTKKKIDLNSALEGIVDLFKQEDEGTDEKDKIYCIAYNWLLTLERLRPNLGQQVYSSEEDKLVPLTERVIRNYMVNILCFDAQQLDVAISSLPPDIKRIHQCIIDCKAMVKTIICDPSNNKNLIFRMRELLLPHEVRYVKELSRQDTDRTKIFNTFTGEIELRTVNPQRGAEKPKGYRWTKKTSLTLLPPKKPERMELFHSSETLSYVVGFLYDRDECKFKRDKNGNDKYIWPANARSNLKLWVGGRRIIRSISLQQLIDRLSEDTRKKWYHNEILACLSRSALKALFLRGKEDGENNLADRINLIRVNKLIYDILHLRLPLLIISPQHGVYEYSIDNQIEDLRTAAESRYGSKEAQPLYALLTSYGEGRDLDFVINAMREKCKAERSLLFRIKIDQVSLLPPHEHVRAYDLFLHEAVENKEEDLIRDLISKGASLTVEVKHKIPLIRAVETKYEKVIPLLMPEALDEKDEKQCAEKQGVYDKTLLFASDWGRYDLVRTLLDRGAHPTYSHIYPERTLLYNLIRHNEFELFNTILKDYTIHLEFNTLVSWAHALEKEEEVFYILYERTELNLDSKHYQSILEYFIKSDNAKYVTKTIDWLISTEKSAVFNGRESRIKIQEALLSCITEPSAPFHWDPVYAFFNALAGKIDLDVTFYQPILFIALENQRSSLALKILEKYYINSMDVAVFDPVVTKILRTMDEPCIDFLLARGKDRETLLEKAYHLMAWESCVYLLPNPINAEDPQPDIYSSLLLQTLSRGKWVCAKKLLEVGVALKREEDCPLVHVMHDNPLELVLIGPLLDKIDADAIWAVHRSVDSVPRNVLEKAAKEGQWEAVKSFISWMKVDAENQNIEQSIRKSYQRVLLEAVLASNFEVVEGITDLLGEPLEGNDQQEKCLHIMKTVLAQNEEEKDFFAFYPVDENSIDRGRSEEASLLQDVQLFALRSGDMELFKTSWFFNKGVSFKFNSKKNATILNCAAQHDGMSVLKQYVERESIDEIGRNLSLENIILLVIFAFAQTGNQEIAQKIFPLLPNFTQEYPTNKLQRLSFIQKALSQYPVEEDILKNIIKDILVWSLDDPRYISRLFGHRHTICQNSIVKSLIAQKEWTLLRNTLDTLAVHNILLEETLYNNIREKAVEALEEISLNVRERNLDLERIVESLESLLEIPRGMRIIRNACKRYIVYHDRKRRSRNIFFKAVCAFFGLFIRLFRLLLRLKSAYRRAEDLLEESAFIIRQIRGSESEAEQESIGLQISGFLGAASLAMYKSNNCKHSLARSLAWDLICNDESVLVENSENFLLNISSNNFDYYRKLAEDNIDHNLPYNLEA